MTTWLPNVSVDRFLDGCEESVIRIPEIIKNWDTLDSKLKFEYRDQIEWMVDTIQVAAKLDNVTLEQLRRMSEIVKGWLENQAEILIYFKIDIYSIMPLGKHAK